MEKIKQPKDAIYIKPHPRCHCWGLLEEFVNAQREHDYDAIHVISINIARYFELYPHAWVNQRYMKELQKFVESCSEIEQNIIRNYFEIYEENEDEKTHDKC